VQAQKTPVDSLKNVLNTAINDTLRVNVLNQIAFLLRNSDIKTSFNYVLQANELAKKINYKNGIAESYGYMGLLYYREGKHDLSVEAHLKSLRLYEELGNKRFIAFRYNDLGNVYVEQEFYDRARANFNLSLSIKEQIKDEEGIVTTMKNIANLYVHQRNYPKALEICLRILPRAEKVNNPRTIADIHSFIAECYLHQDSLAKAMLYYEKVYEVRLKANDQYTIPRLLNGIGRVYFKQKNYQKAKETYEKSIEIAQKNNIKVALKRAYEYLADLYEAQKDYEKAFYYEKIANAYKDSLYNQKSNDRIAVLQSIFDDEKNQNEREREKELQNAKIKQQRIVIIASSLVAVMLAVLTIMLWQNNQEKAKKNQALYEQKQEIEAYNRSIRASIMYAQRIQEAILPQEQDFSNYFKDSFLLYLPKDIVSGDFYWVYAISNPQSEYYGQRIVAVADCTGHSVPGGFMSMIGNDLLDKIIIEKEIYDPASILEVLNISLNEVLNKDTTNNMDGMEIAICRIDTLTRQIVYAGSMISLLIFEDGELTEYPADKYYLGGRHRDLADNPEFSVKEITLKSNNSFIYLSTDGFQDQLGGEKYRKFSSKRFKALLKEIQEKPLSEQKAMLHTAFKNWQKHYPQTDDVLVLGVKV
jgi:serine phosphatase RsbU (regulator of sigma subunit)